MSMTVDEALGFIFCQEKTISEIRETKPDFEPEPIFDCASVLAAEVRRLRQESNDQKQYINKVNDFIGGFPLWVGDMEADSIDASMLTEIRDL